MMAQVGGGGGEGTHMKGQDACRLAEGCKFRILVSLRVFWAKSHYTCIEL